MRRRELERAAAVAGLTLTPGRRTAWLPPARCSTTDRDLVMQLAAARGVSVGEHIRSRATAPLTAAERAARKVRP